MNYYYAGFHRLTKFTTSSTGYFKQVESLNEFSKCTSKFEVQTDFKTCKQSSSFQMAREREKKRGLI